MYCTKCGNELKNSESFCPNCGTKVGESGKQIGLNDLADYSKDKFTDVKSNFNVGLANLGKYKMIFFVNLALVILNMFICTAPLFEASSILGISKSITLFEDSDGLKVIFVILYLISAVLIVLPLLLKKAVTGKYFLLEKIITIASASWFFILWCFAGVVADSSYGTVSFKISFLGVLFILATVGAIILSFKIPRDLKMNSKE